MAEELLPLIDDATAQSRVAEPFDEEIINAATHSIGFLLSVAAAGTLIVSDQFGDWAPTATCVIYLITLVLVYAVSALSHAVQKPGPKYMLSVWDQGVIYFLIAGTYTPFAWAYLPDAYRAPILTLIWLPAFLGFVSKVVFHHRVRDDFSPVTYVLLGWLPAMVILPFVPVDCLMWMAFGGLAYTVGTTFLMMDHKVRFFHAAWHLFVIAGSAIHFYAVMHFIVLS